MRRHHGGLSGGFWGIVTGVLCAGATLAGLGCQPEVQVREEPIALRPPAELVERVNGAQADFIGAMSSVATDYDRVICADARAESARGFGRQALAEATLEVARARGEARRATSARGGGPAGQGDGITMIEEPAEEARSGLHWQCVQADAQPECVTATANIVARRVYLERVDGYDLDPLVVSDILEAFAADLRWAGDFMSQADTAPDALDAIRKGCEAGDSPLAGYLEEALETNNVARRAGLTQLQSDLVGEEADLCSALPAFYSRTIQDLGTSLAQHSRTRYCVNRPWAILE